MSNRFAGFARRSLRVLRTVSMVVTIIGGSLFAVAKTGAAIVEEAFEKKYTVNSDATLSIRNLNGAVRIYGGTGSEIVIRANKRAFSVERLKEMAIESKGSPEGVEVESIVPLKKGFELADRSGTIDYAIVVPSEVRITRLELEIGEVWIEGLRVGNVTARVGEGWLVTKNCFSAMDLTLRNGRLQAIYDFWEATPFQAKLTSPEGDIRVYFSPEATISISARTSSGRILNWLDKAENDPRKPLRTLDFSFGATPSAKFEMESKSGDIRIQKAW